jgi:5-methylcytosine-specific restriction endonuclease McrA
MITKINILRDDELKNILNESFSIREVLNKIGYSSNGSGGYSQLKNECKLRNIEIPNYEYLGTSRVFNKKINDNDMFIENCSISRQAIKKRIINNNLIEYKCLECDNIGEWNGKKLSLQLEHKNGINNDNRLENLCFLCANCHSQTETYSGKSNKRK